MQPYRSLQSRLENQAFCSSLGVSIGVGLLGENPNKISLVMSDSFLLNELLCLFCESLTQIIEWIDL